jgi:hypothetical protein
MIRIEHTDTFGGESNYSWVRRTEIPNNKSRRSIVRQAKKFAGITNVRCVVDDFGDLIAIRPRGLCQVVFCTWGEE